MSFRNFYEVVFLLMSLVFQIQSYQSLHFPFKPKLSLTSLQRNCKRGRTSLNSYGDPDKSTESVLYRKWQQFSRIYDYLLFPDEVDCPGLTFPSPIEWAPWMETIWFGNYYDYRAAFFNDVMYSNNLEGKEGALLIPLPSKARSAPDMASLTSYPMSLDLALLYQRYNKFNQQSYSISNLTYYNIFGTDTLRVGRYKLPQTPELILCVTEPLTYSEVKRYLTSFSPIKWLKSKFFQQKRKRQWLLTFDPPSNTTNKKGGKVDQDVSYFSRMIYLLEYFKMIEYLTLHQPSSSLQRVGYIKDILRLILTEKIENFDLKMTELTMKVAENYCFPTQTIPILASSFPKEEIQFILQNPERQTITTEMESLFNESVVDISDGSVAYGFTLPLSTVNSQQFIENLFQSLIHHLSSKTNKSVDPKEWEIILGGDQRLLNSYALEIAVRVLLANQFTNIHIAEQSLYTMSLAQQYYSLDRNKGRIDETRYSLSIIFDGGVEPSGINGRVGLQLLLTDRERLYYWTVSDFNKLFHQFETISEVKILPNTMKSLTLNYFNYPMSKPLLSYDTLETLKSLPYHEYSIPIQREIYRSSYSYPSDQLEMIKEFIQEKNILLVIDGSYGVTKQILTLTHIHSKLGIDLSESYIDNDYQDKDERLVDADQPYPILDEGKNLYHELYKLRAAEIEDTVMGDLFQIKSSDDNDAQCASEDKYDSCPDIGFSISPDGSECQVSFLELLKLFNSLIFMIF